MGVSAPALGGPAVGDEPQINALLRYLVDLGASDLHLMCGAPVKVRIHGDMTDVLMNGKPMILTPEITRGWMYEIMTDERIVSFEQEGDLDFAHRVAGVSRFRVNVMEAVNGPGAVFRAIPEEILTLEDLGLPEMLTKISEYTHGLVLVTGPTGSGKSTTLAAMINHINTNRGGHIITIEDPVEFVHENKKCRITHREVGEHTQSFEDALRVALRQDPNIVLVGEMRDLETIRLALQAAETGVMVFGTLHTNTAVSTINRVIDAFPSEEQNQIRTMLAESLSAVVAQTLLKTADGKGRVAAQEIMIVTSAIRAAIRENKIEQIGSMLQTGKREGMQTLDDHLQQLMENMRISPEVARERAIDKRRFR